MPEGGREGEVTAAQPDEGGRECVSDNVEECPTEVEEYVSQLGCHVTCRGASEKLVDSQPFPSRS